VSRFRHRQVLTILSLALVAALFAVLVVRLTESDPGPGFVSAVRAGSKPAAPPFDLPVIWPSAETWPAQLRPGVGRGKVSLSDLRGFPTVLNFWASWCTACGAEARQLARTARADRPGAGSSRKRSVSSPRTSLHPESPAPRGAERG